MKEVLVVIDNLKQYSRIKTIVNRKKKTSNFTFKHSAIRSDIWEHEDFKGKIDSHINIKSQVSELVKTYDLIISVHCFQFFPKELVNNVRCINIHPGYNPINRGWYPQVFALLYGHPIGATIHEMDEKLDHGPIIVREFVEINPWDTSLSVYNRVLDKEIQLFNDNFEAIIEGTYDLITPENEGNIYSKADFKNLCELDMTEQGSFQQFYNRLRALTHGDYKNAFFVESNTGKKIYLKLDIIHE